MKIYTVHAFRWSNRERHSYIVGVYSDIPNALNAANIEEEWRGGTKYRCEVLEWTLDKGIAGDSDIQPKVIKQLN